MSLFCPRRWPRAILLRGGAASPLLVLQTSRVDGVEAFRRVCGGRRRPPLRDRAGIAEQNARKAGSELPFCVCLPAQIVRHLSLVNCCSRRAPQRQAAKKGGGSYEN